MRYFTKYRLTILMLLFFPAILNAHPGHNPIPHSLIHLEWIVGLMMLIVFTLQFASRRLKARKIVRQHKRK